MSSRTAHGVAFLIALAGVILANHEPLLAWVGLWLHAGHDYGLVVFAACLWLIWRRRRELATAPLQTERLALLAIVPLAVALWLAYAIDLRIAQLILLIPGMAAIVLAVLGRPALRLLAGAIAMLFLALPIWNYFKPVLQELTVAATVIALRVTGLPVFVDETYVNIPGRAIVVLAECSGAQYFQAGVTIGALYAYLNFRLPWLRLLVLCSFALVAIVGNWIRVDVLVFLGTLTETQHFMVGWGIFALLMTLAFAAAMRLQAYEDKAWRTRSSPAIGVGATAGNGGGALIVVASLAALLLAAPPLMHRIVGTTGFGGQLPPVVTEAPWSGPYPAKDDWRPSFMGADRQSIENYRAPEGEVTLYRALYIEQRQGAEVVNELNSVYDTRWVQRGGHARSDVQEIQLPDGTTLHVLETRLQHPSDGSERLVWHWYHVAGTDVVRPWRAKLAQVAGLVHGRADAMVIVLSTDGADVVKGRKALAAFVSATAGTLTGRRQEVSR